MTSHSNPKLLDSTAQKNKDGENPSHNEDFESGSKKYPLEDDGLPVTTLTKNLTLLNRSSLPHLPSSITAPTFNPAHLHTGIVHLGCGAFHRAHQAAITQEAIEVEGETGNRWGITSVCMHGKTLYDLLLPQDNIYSLLLREPKQMKAQVIGTLHKVLHAPTDPLGISHRIAQPNVKIVTLTVTAGGYSIVPETALLDTSNSDVQHDLDLSKQPLTVVATLTRALAEIKENGGTPPVILSCDNLSANGRTLGRAVRDFAALYDDKLSTWIEKNVQFPATVVDRIAQPETEQDLEDAARLLGYIDKVPVPTEPQWDWSIEEFEGDRPLWEEVGVRYVKDIDAYELGKLRILNGTHMLLAYLGALNGYNTIAEAASDPIIGSIAKQFMITEQGKTLTLDEAHLRKTVKVVMERFENPSIYQEIIRVGRNGSEKMIHRVVSAMKENQAAGRSTPAACLLIAAWIRCFVQLSKDPNSIPLVDPLSDELTELARKHRNNPRELAKAFLDRTDIFGEIRTKENLDCITDILSDFDHHGVCTVVRHLLLPEFGGTSA